MLHSGSASPSSWRRVSPGRGMGLSLKAGAWLLATSGPAGCLLCCPAPGAGAGAEWLLLAAVSRCVLAGPGAGALTWPRWPHTSLGTWAVTTLGLVDTRVWHTCSGRIQTVCLITLCKVSSHLARPLVALLLGHLHGLCDGEGGALLGGDVDALLPLHLHPTATTCHPCCWCCH